MEKAQQLLERLLEGLPNPFIAPAVLLLFFGLCLFALRRRQPKEILAFQNQAGQVTVARQAITDLVKRVCLGNDSVGKCAIRIRMRRNALNIVVRIQLLAGSHLNDVTSALQDGISRTLQDNLGIENLGDINIVVTGFMGHTDLSGAERMDSTKDLGDPE